MYAIMNDMIKHAFHPYGSEARVFDLRTGFDDPQLSDFGELRIFNFKHPLFMYLGKTTLSILRVPTPVPRPDTTQNNLYVIQNTRDPNNYTVFGDYDGASSHANGLLTIGRGEDATPALELDPTVSRRHATIRSGDLIGGRYIADAGSANGTLVALHPEDVRNVYERCKTLIYPTNPSKETPVRTQVSVNRRWLQRP